MGKTLTIMIIDDDKDIGESMLMAIALTENKSIYYSNPVEAVKEYLKHPEKYDVIFTDIQMPELNGQEVIAQIRKTDKDVPIVIITATSGIFTTEDLVKLNVPSLILKPFDIADIELAIRQIQVKDN
jgi:two-component system response regulator PilR (NtrC family)